MNGELVLVALIVGLGTWAMRVVPTLLSARSVDPDGPVSRFLNATGPAAIAALCVASFLPLLEADWRPILMLGAGIAGTILGFWIRRDISLATVLGAAAYGLTFWLV